MIWQIIAAIGHGIRSPIANRFERGLAPSTARRIADSMRSLRTRTSWRKPLALDGSAGYTAKRNIWVARALIRDGHRKANYHAAVASCFTAPYSGRHVRICEAFPRFAAAVVSLVVLSPVLIPIVAWIKLSSRGPVLYRDVRVGRGGVPFYMLKFRTMVVDADKLGASSTSADGPRITHVNSPINLSMSKRLFDITVSLLGLVIFSPLILAIAIWVKLDSPGPVFYRGKRAGRDNCPFGIFKFRSMVVNADRIGGSSTSGDDPRITRSGRFIRRHKIDEFSQLLNVLVGDMSLVGPRPEILRYTDQYQGEYRAILSVRPGITDWASIWNADEGAVLEGAINPDLAYEQLIQPTKLRLQLRYVRERNFWIDMVIIFHTLRRLADSDFLPEELADIPRLSPGSRRRACLVAPKAAGPVPISRTDCK